MFNSTLSVEVEENYGVASKSQTRQWTSTLRRAIRVRQETPPSRYLPGYANTKLQLQQSLPSARPVAAQTNLSHSVAAKSPTVLRHGPQRRMQG